MPITNLHDDEVQSIRRILPSADVAMLNSVSRGFFAHGELDWFDSVCQENAPIIHPGLVYRIQNPISPHALPANKIKSFITTRSINPKLRGLLAFYYLVLVFDDEPLRHAALKQLHLLIKGTVFDLIIDIYVAEKLGKEVDLQYSLDKLNTFLASSTTPIELLEMTLPLLPVRVLKANVKFYIHSLSNLEHNLTPHAVFNLRQACPRLFDEPQSFSTLLLETMSHYDVNDSLDDLSSSQALELTTLLNSKQKMVPLNLRFQLCIADFELKLSELLNELKGYFLNPQLRLYSLGSPYVKNINQYLSKAPYLSASSESKIMDCLLYIVRPTCMSQFLFEEDFGFLFDCIDLFMMLSKNTKELNKVNFTYHLLEMLQSFFDKPGLIYEMWTVKAICLLTTLAKDDPVFLKYKPWLTNSLKARKAEQGDFLLQALKPIIKDLDEQDKENYTRLWLSHMNSKGKFIKSIEEHVGKDIAQKIWLETLSENKDDFWQRGNHYLAMITCVPIPIEKLDGFVDYLLSISPTYIPLSFKFADINIFRQLFAKATFTQMERFYLKLYEVFELISVDPEMGIANQPINGDPRHVILRSKVEIEGACDFILPFCKIFLEKYPHSEALTKIINYLLNWLRTMPTASVYYSEFCKNRAYIKEALGTCINQMSPEQKFIYAEQMIEDCENIRIGSLSSSGLLCALAGYDLCNEFFARVHALQNSNSSEIRLIGVEVINAWYPYLSPKILEASTSKLMLQQSNSIHPRSY